MREKLLGGYADKLYLKMLAGAAAASLALGSCGGSSEDYTVTIKPPRQPEAAKTEQPQRLIRPVMIRAAQSIITYARDHPGQSGLLVQEDTIALIVNEKKRFQLQDGRPEKNGAALELVAKRSSDDQSWPDAKAAVAVTAGMAYSIPQGQSQAESFMLASPAGRQFLDTKGAPSFAGGWVAEERNSVTGPFGGSEGARHVVGDVPAILHDAISSLRFTAQSHKFKIGY